MMVEGWEHILAIEIEKARHKPFRRGRHDCCMWTARVVKAITGIDYAKEYRGKYNSDASALRILKKTPLEQILDGKFERIKHPMRGDIVMLASVDEMPSLGICLGVDVAAIGEHGLIFESVTSILAAWSLPRGEK